MTTDDNHSEMHQGHHLESGVLARVRAWTDVLSWIRLVHVLRVSASPTSVIMVAVVYCLWRIGVHDISPSMISSSSTLRATATECARVGASVNLSSLCLPGYSHTLVSGLLLTGWSLAWWTPVMLILARQGGLLTAGRSLEDFRSLFQRSIRRTPSAWITSITPGLCTTVFGVTVLLLGGGMRWVNGIAWLEYPLGLLMAIVAIPMGVLLFGSFFATPLAFASIANESQPDPLDSLSRGYESLYRRPVHLLFYLAVASLLVALIWLLASGVTHLAITAMTFWCDLAGTGIQQQAIISVCLSRLPVILSLTTLFAMIGGVYLLIRQSTGEQEVEDLWMPESPVLPPMPQPLS